MAEYPFWSKEKAALTKTLTFSRSNRLEHFPIAYHTNIYPWLYLVPCISSEEEWLGNAFSNDRWCYQLPPRMRYQTKLNAREISSVSHRVQSVSWFGEAGTLLRTKRPPEQVTKTNQHVLRRSKGYKGHRTCYITYYCQYSCTYSKRVQ